MHSERGRALFLSIRTGWSALSMVRCSAMASALRISDGKVSHEKEQHAGPDSDRYIKARRQARKHPDGGAARVRGGGRKSPEEHALPARPIPGPAARVEGQG